jgi:hypothetical protein
MAGTWTPDELERIAAADELEIASIRADDTPRRSLPIWVVRAGDEVYVRTWARRENGWFGHVVQGRQARIRVPGVEVDVDIEDVGVGTPDLRAAVDAAYRDKYGRYGRGTVDRMVSDDAAAATLRLSPARS